MTRSFSAGRGLLSAWLVLAVLTSPVWSALPEAPPRAPVPEKLAGAFARFDEWVARHVDSPARSASAPVAPDEITEGHALARARRAAWLDLARTDPREALARALSPATLRRLPAAVQDETETYVDACGAAFDFEIADDFSDPDAPVSRPSRSLTVGGRTYEAKVFGRRAGLESKTIHANGVAMGDVLVLYEEPLRRMDAEEAAEDAMVAARCAAMGPACVAAKVGAQTLVFPDEAALARHRAALEAAEEKARDGQPAGREEALRPQAAGGAADASGGAVVAAASPWTSGEKHVLYIRVDFSDRPGEPVAANVAQSTIDVAVSDYYRQTSYDTTSMRATVTPVLRMPRTAAQYLSTGDGQLLTDGRAAAKAAGFDPAAFDRDIVAFVRLFDGYSGKARVGGKGVWLNGSFGASVTIHELGHNYGVHHANFWQTTDGTVIGSGSNVEYGNVFDVMGRGGVRGHFNAWFKSRMDWLTPLDFTTVTASGTYTIDPVDDPASAGPRALKIVRDATRSYWLEFRELYTTNRWASNGLLLNWGYNSNTGSHLLDSTPGSANAQNDAPLLVGRTFSDTAAGLHVTPVARTASPSRMDVVVKMGAFPGNTAPAATLAASATSVARNVPVTFTVSASDVNGDELAYGWIFDDGTIAPNAASVGKSWSTAGTKTVQCVVSDMVGGLTTVSTTVTVTSVATFNVSGTVTANGAGLAGVVVSDGTRSATTSAAGAYSLAGVPNGTYTLTPGLTGFTFTPATLAVTVNGANVGGRNFAASPVPAGVVLEARFDGAADAFTYADDTFRGTAQPAYASGVRITTGGFSGGAARVFLGGVDEADVVGMSGGWRATFDLPAAQNVVLSFRYRLTQTPDYESDERSEVLASLDGSLLGTGGVVASVVGNGNGGSSRTTGWQLFQATVPLPAGPHTLVLGGFNSQKTTASESTEVLIDDVVVSRP